MVEAESDWQDRKKTQKDIGTGGREPIGRGLKSSEGGRRKGLQVAAVYKIYRIMEERKRLFLQKKFGYAL